MCLSRSLLKRINLPFLLLSFTFSFQSFAKTDSNTNRKVANSAEEYLNEEDLNDRLLTLVGVIKPVTSLITRSNDILSYKASDFPVKLGKFNMHCGKYITKKMGGSDRTDWVEVKPESDEEKNKIENQFGENGEVELTLEVNKFVKEKEDVSFVLRINDRFIVDRLTEFQSDKLEVDKETTKDICTHKYKGNYQKNDDSKSIFWKTDLTTCGNTETAVNTEINKAVYDGSKTKVIPDNFEIFVQHLVLEKGKKSSQTKVISNLAVSCNFEPIKE